MKQKRNDSGSRYNIKMILENKPYNKEMSMTAIFLKSDSGYGNDLYLKFIGTRGCTFEHLVDLRYEKLDLSNPELIILNILYNMWSGKDGSLDIKSLTITHDGRYESKLSGMN